MAGVAVQLLSLYCSSLEVCWLPCPSLNSLTGSMRQSTLACSMPLHSLKQHHRCPAELSGCLASQVVCHHKNTNIEIDRKLLACLQPRQWLNDEVMNIFIGLLQV